MNTASIEPKFLNANLNEKQTRKIWFGRFYSTPTQYTLYSAINMFLEAG